MRETKRLKPLVLLALLATVVMTSSCKSESIPTPIENNPKETKETVAGDEIIATIGEASISRQQLLDRLLSTYGTQMLRSMMLIEAVNEEAHSLRIDVTDEELEQELRIMRQGYEDEEQFYRSIKEQLGMSREEVREDAHYRLLLEKLSIRNVIVTESEIDLYLKEHQEALQPLKRYQLAKIVVGTKEQAEDLLSQLTGGADFAALARTYSLDEFTADEGGEIGWVEDQDPFESRTILQAAASLQVGEVTGPLQTDEGYVIVRLDGRSESQKKSESEIRMEIKRQLALGKADSMRDLEQALLIKYHADVMLPSLRP